MMKEKAMTRHIFAGNYITGSMVFDTISAGDDDLQEQTLDRLCVEVGLTDDVLGGCVVWADYDGRNSIEACKKGFDAYMRFHAKKTIVQ